VRLATMMCLVVEEVRQRGRQRLPLLSRLHDRAIRNSPLRWASSSPSTQSMMRVSSASAPAAAR
jgi:hypothetical protein